MKPSLRVHVIPFGRDEPKRIVYPTDYLKADKIYLLSISKKEARPVEYEEIKDALLKDVLSKPEDLIEKKVDFYDLSDLLRTYAEIFRLEKAEGNTVYVNLAGGTMLTLAATLSCILFNGVPYFLKKDYETGKLNLKPKFLELPHYIMEQPNEDLTYLLTFMSEYMKLKKTDKISKGKCIDFLMKSGRDRDFGGKKPKDYNKLNVRYLNKLTAKKLIVVEEKTRGEISLTEDGKLAESVFSVYHDVNLKEIISMIKK